MKDLPELRVAIVCDWLTGIGGAERVVLELHHMFPEAPIYTSQYDPVGIDWFKGADIRTTWLQKLPKGLKKFLPILRIWAFSSLKFDDYDLVISASGAEAKGIKTGALTLHINYCHSPTHYYWMRYDDYLQHPGFGLFDPVARLGLRLLVGPLRYWDLKAAKRPDYMIANSTFTKQNIKKYYNRESTVIHPPVDVERFESSKQTGGRTGFITAGRQTPYKRIDLAVAACSRLGAPLFVIGDGPDHDKLKVIAGPNVTFLTNTSDSDVAKYFSRAEAFIFPGIDDFGIVAVEAMAAGIPVIAYKAGGALDYVVPSKTGEFFESQTVEALADALTAFRPGAFDKTTLQQSARQFSAAEFREKLADEITKLVTRQK